MHNYEKTMNFIVMHVSDLPLCSSNIPKPRKMIKFGYMEPIFIYNIYIYKKKKLQFVTIIANKMCFWFYPSMFSALLIDVYIPLFV